MIARALMAGQSRKALRPLPASRRRQLRAEVLADVAAIKKVRNGARDERSRSGANLTQYSTTRITD